MGKGSIADATYNLEASLDNSQTSRVAVVHQSRNILPWHFRKLFLEQRFEAGKEDEGLWFMIVFDRDDLDITFPQLSSGRLFSTNGGLTECKYFVPSRANTHSSRRPPNAIKRHPRCQAVYLVFVHLVFNPDAGFGYCDGFAVGFRSVVQRRGGWLCCVRLL